MGFKYFNHPLAMSNSEVDRLNRVLDGAHLREHSSWEKWRSDIAELRRQSTSDNLQELLDKIKKSKK